MNSRNTIQKKLVLDAVRELKCHATAEEIYARVSAVYPAISKGTVYRNLNMLAADGQIRKIEMTGAADRFDHISESHYHVICIRCGRVFDVDMEPIPFPADRIRDTCGFDFLECDIVFKGVCPACKSTTEVGQRDDMESEK